MKMIILTDKNILLVDGNVSYGEKSIDVNINGKILVNEETDEDIQKQFINMTMIGELLKLLHSGVK